MLLGSYFGDWDNESNFLRAPLGSTSSALAVAWAGRPHWFFHHMALGQTIGLSTRLSQNNRQGGLYSAQNYSTRGIHVALLGDPTLRMHPVRPPSDLKAAPSAAGLTLSWSPSPETDLRGYHVYRATTLSSPFVRVTPSTPITETTYTDTFDQASASTYMVRAVKLERSASGTYLNPSQGIFFGPDQGTSWGGEPTPAAPSVPSGVVASALSASQVLVRWNDTADNELGFRIERESGSGVYVQIGVVGPNVTHFQDGGLTPGTVYSYRIAAFNTAAVSNPSAEVTASTPGAPAVPASAHFVALDDSTGGDWSGPYGSDGYHVIGAAVQYPAYAAVSPVGQSEWTWAWVTGETRGLQDVASNTRLASAWYSTTSFTVNLNLYDGQAHQVALYCLDWDSAARRQTVEILDASTGAVLNSQAISNFHRGVYLVWNLSGNVAIRLTRNGGNNVTLSGLFFDLPASAPATVTAPVITPDGGNIFGPTSVSLTTSTLGAVIRYTDDGSEPTAASSLYEGALTVVQSTIIKAKAFHSNMTESAVTTARFTFDPISSGQARALFVRQDNTTQGNWKGVYGSEGYHIVGDSGAQPRYPSYVEVSSENADTFVWNEATVDSRALLRATAPSRTAGCWFRSDAFEVDVNFIDGRTHRLALYCPDWDTTSRQQRVELLDAASGALITGQTISAFNQGTYLVWDIRGHIRIRLTRFSGNNAVLMGLFFSPAAAQLADSGSGVLAMTSRPGADVRLRIAGQVGERFAIQASTDLVQWNEIRQITLSAASQEFMVPRAVDCPRRYYRALPVAVEP